MGLFDILSYDSTNTRRGEEHIRFTAGQDPYGNA